jgi:hypothetical protein
MDKISTGRWNIRNLWFYRKISLCSNYNDRITWYTHFVLLDHENLWWNWCTYKTRCYWRRGDHCTFTRMVNSSLAKYFFIISKIYAYLRYDDSLHIPIEGVTSDLALWGDSYRCVWTNVSRTKIYILFISYSFKRKYHKVKLQNILFN